MYQEAATQSSEQGSLLDSKPFVSALSNLLHNQLEGQQNIGGQQAQLGSIREDIFPGQEEHHFIEQFGDDPTFLKSNTSGNMMVINRGQGMMNKPLISQQHAGMISHQSSGAEIEAHHNNLSRSGVMSSNPGHHPMLISNNSSTNIRPGSKIAFVLDHNAGSLDSTGQSISGGVGNNPNPGYYRYSQEENSSDV